MQKEMKYLLSISTNLARGGPRRTVPRPIGVSAGVAVVAFALLLGATGCGTTHPDEPPSAYGSLALSRAQADQTNHVAEPAPGAAVATESLRLREGDTVNISFPGAPTLNTIQQVRRDGKISLPTKGEFKAAGLRPQELEVELMKLYGPELQVQEVTVAVQSSSFPVYVAGAVLRPGKVLSERPLSALEAIMEAGGFDPVKANLKKVKVVRQEDGHAVHHTLDLKRALDGKEAEPFALQPFDIIYVPERFAWF